MHEHLQITFRGMSPSPAVEALIHERVERLTHTSALLLRCHVVLEQPHRHQKKGRQFSVRLDITTPFGEVVVSRAPEGVNLYQPLQTLVRDAFDAATRQLEDQVDRRRAG
jgi:hypothetical protein